MDHYDFQVNGVFEQVPRAFQYAACVRNYFHWRNIMEMIRSLVARLVREEDGAAAAEYAILVAFIAAAVATAVAFFDLDTIFQTVSSKVIGWINSAPNAT